MSTIHNSREYPLNPEAVFAAIENPARLARWWGPEGFRNTFHTFEFRNGGSWLFTMHGPDGTDYPNESAFLDIVPNELVRIGHLNHPHFELTIALEPTANGTRMTWHAVFESAEFVAQLRDFLNKSNEQNLDRLAQELGVG